MNAKINIITKQYDEKGKLDTIEYEYSWRYIL